MSRFAAARLGVLVVLASLAAGTEARGDEVDLVATTRGELSGLSGTRLVILNDQSEERFSIALGAGRSETHKIDLGENETVTCAGEGVWCPRLAAVAGGAERRFLDVFPRVLFQMPIVLPAGERWSDETLHVESWPQAQQQTDSSLGLEPAFELAGEVTVSATGLMATWFGPAGVQDLRVAAEGWAPAYLFDVEASPETTVFPPVKLVRGASVSAIALDLETGAAVHKAEVTLRLPDVEFNDERAQRFRSRGTTNERGFVQIQAVPPGIYDLVFESEHRPPTYVRELETAAGHETWIGNVQLPGYAQLAILVEPKTNNGEFWRIEATQLHEPWADVAMLADQNGAAVLERLVQGSWNVSVRRARADLVHSEDIWIGNDEQQLFVDLDLTQVEGRVLLDGDGVEAEVDLATGAGDRSSFDTNDEGRFRGSIPRPLQEWIVAFVKTDSGVARTFRLKPRLREGVYRLRLELGDRAIHGRILDSRSLDPLPDASVMIRRPSDDSFYPSERTTDAAGSFAFRGLDDADHELTAYRDGYTEARLSEVRSAPDTADTHGAEGPSGITVLLQPGTPLDVSVTSMSGIPQRGANLALFTLTPEGVGVGDVETDLAGRGQVVVPRSVLPAAVVVRAPSGVLWSGCMSLPEEGNVLHVQIPSDSGGTLVLQRSRAESGEEPSPTPDQDLVSNGGGLLRIQDFLQWTANLGLPLPARDTFQIPRVASGYYAVTESLPLGLEAYPMACQGAVRTSGSWQYLPAGGQLETPFRFEPVDDSSFWIPHMD